MQRLTISYDLIILQEAITELIKLLYKMMK